MSRRADGRLWERRARRYLHERGVEVVQAGYGCRFGEIDLVCFDGPTLVLVEVRARGSGSVATALETVDAAKRRRLVCAARHLLMRHPEWSERPLRFDVIAIEGIDTAHTRLAWIRNAFDAE